MSFGPQVYFSVAGPLAIAPDSDAKTDLNPQNTRLRNAWFSGTVTAGAFVTSGGTPGPATFSQVTITQGAITAQAAGLQQTVTWNNAAVTFTAQTLDVTDTASAAGSLMVNYRVGGVTVFGVDKVGATNFGGGSAYQSIVVFRGGSTPTIALDRSGVAGGGIAASSVGDLIVAVTSFTGASIVFKTGVTYNGDYDTTGMAVGTFSPAGNLTLNVSGGQFRWNAKSSIASSANGLINLSNNSQTGFTRLTLGLETNAFPSLKVNGAVVQARLGDDSDYTDVQGGNYAASKLGTGLQVKAGANGRIGTATLVAGTVTVANTSVTANTIILLTVKTDGGTVGNLSWTVIAGTSFTITSSSALDTSTVVWMLVETL